MFTLLLVHDRFTKSCCTNLTSPLPGTATPARASVPSGPVPFTNQVRAESSKAAATQTVASAIRGLWHPRNPPQGFPSRRSKGCRYRWSEAAFFGRIADRVRARLHTLGSSSATSSGAPPVLDLQHGVEKNFGGIPADIPSGSVSYNGRGDHTTLRSTSSTRTPFGLLQMFQPVAEIRTRKPVPNFHGCASVTGGPGLMTIGPSHDRSTRDWTWRQIASPTVVSR